MWSQSRDGNGILLCAIGKELIITEILHLRKLGGKNNQDRQITIIFNYILSSNMTIWYLKKSPLDQAILHDKIKGTYT